MHASELTRRRMIQASAAMGACTLLPGSAHLALAAAPSKSPGLQPKPSGPLTPASVTVTAAARGVIGPAFAGFSYEKSQMAHPFFSASNKHLIALFRLLGPSLLRIGGDSSDKIVWTPDGKGQTYPQTAPSDVAACAAFVKATGWKCLYTVNLGGSANGSTSPALAAAEVAFAAQTFGSSLYGIEIGNEPDAYVKPGRQYDGKDWPLEKFEATWSAYRDAILAKTPGVMITGPAAGHLATWTIPFSEHETKAKMSLLTDHYYRGSGSATNAALLKLISPDPLLISNLKLMREAYEKTGIPYRLDETNSYTGGKLPGISDTYATTLWSLDFMFQCALGGAVGVNFHGGKTVSYSPLMDDQTNVIAISPEFYGMLFFTLAGQGELQQTEMSAGSLNATAYAVKTTTGTNVVVINKDATQNLDLTVHLPGAPASASLLTLNQRSAGAEAPSLAATSGVTIQGSEVGLDGKFAPGSPYTATIKGADITCYVPALSAMLIRTA